MNAEQLIRAESLFHRARELPTADRPRFLRREAGDGDRTRAQVAAMLDRHSMSTRELLGIEPGAVDLSVTASVDGEIGRYRVRERIGAGGFAVVYRAEQTSPVQRQVAIKMLHAGMDDGRGTVRFLAEAQTLARMSHPGVARIFDAGRSSDGRPFFVMELIDGEPITAYCDRNRLSIRSRLRLFASVCEAVQHAHDQGVVHRDLKPSNVLVSAGDGRPQATVIDFGIAKAIGPALIDHAVRTRSHQLFGTPAYMSPEQALSGAGAVDERSDVYSLGVMLQELLIGRTVMEHDRLHGGGLAALPRMHAQATSVRPSDLVRVPGARAASRSRAAARRRRRIGRAAAQRATRPRLLRRRLRRDLDLIIMMARETDRERRYGSASDLAADIRRHLQHRDIVAASPGAAHRLGKLARRHRAAVLAAAASALLMLPILVCQTVSLHRARAEAEGLRRTRSMVPITAGCPDTSVGGGRIAARKTPDPGDWPLLLP